MRNLEIKCRCEDLGVMRARAGRLGARDMGSLEQADTFFAASDGRLKLRDFGNGSGELIAYRRPDSLHVRGSDYHIYPTADPERLAGVLREALGVPGRVRKRRHLFLLEHTRIHLDEVEGLGSFVELETVLSSQSEEEARAELQRIAAALELRPEDRVAVSYVDLLVTLGRETTSSRGNVAIAGCPPGASSSI